MSRVDVFREACEGFVQLQRGDLALGGCEGVSAEDDEDKYPCMLAHLE